MKRTANVLTFSWGEVPCPDDKWPTAPRRKDGDLDLRFKSACEWWDWFWKCEKAGRLV